MRKAKGFRIFTAAMLVAAQVLSGCSGAFAEEAAWDAQEPVVAEAAAEFSEALNEEIPEDEFLESDAAVPGEDPEAAQDYDEAAEATAADEELLDEAPEELFEDVIDDEEDAVVFEEEFFETEGDPAEEELLVEEDASETVDNMAAVESVTIYYNNVHSSMDSYIKLSRRSEVVTRDGVPQGCEAEKAGTSNYYIIGWARSELATGYGTTYMKQQPVLESDDNVIVPEIDWDNLTTDKLYYSVVLGSFGGTYIKWTVSDPNNGWITSGESSQNPMPSSLEYPYVFASPLTDSSCVLYKDIGPRWTSGTPSSSSSVYAAVAAEGYRIDHWELNGVPFETPPRSSGDSDIERLWNFGQWTYSSSQFVSTGINELTAVIVPVDENIGSYKISYESKDNNTGSVTRRFETYNGNGSLKGSVASPKEGYQFKEWQNEEGEQISTDAKYIPDASAITGDTTFYAVFESLPRTRYIFKTVGKDGNGHGKLVFNQPYSNADVIVEKNTDHEIIVTVPPVYNGTNFYISLYDSTNSWIQDPWHFVKWQAEGSSMTQTSMNLYQSALPRPQSGEDITVNAVFEPDTIYKISVSSNDDMWGSVEVITNSGSRYKASKTYTTNGTGRINKGNSGDPRYLAPKPQSGFVFDHWELDGNVLNTGSSQNADISGVFDSDHVYTAFFKPEPGTEDQLVTVNVKTNGLGTLSVVTSWYNNTGDNFSLKLLPGKSTLTVNAVNNNDCHIVKWTCSDGSDPIINQTLKLQEIPAYESGSITYTAEFIENEGSDYLLSYAVNNETYGEIRDAKTHVSINGQSSRVNKMTGQITQAFYAQAASADYIFDYWELNGKKMEGHTASYFTTSSQDLLLSGDSTIKAVFREKTDEEKQYITYVFQTRDENNNKHGSLVIDEAQYDSLIQERKAGYYVLSVSPDDTTNFYVVAANNASSADPWHFTKWVDENGKTLAYDQEYMSIRRSALPKANPGETKTITALYKPDQKYKISVKSDNEAYGIVEKVHLQNSYSPYISNTYEQITSDLYTNRVTGYVYTGGQSEYNEHYPAYYSSNSNIYTYYNKNYCIHPKPNDGYLFDHWEKDGKPLEAGAPEAGALNVIFLNEHFTADHTYTAVFIPDPETEDQMVTVTIKTNGHGSLIFGNQKEEGESFTFKHLPGQVSYTVEAVNSEEGYHIQQWTCSDGSDPVNQKKLQISEIKASDSGEVTYTAEFVPDEGTEYKLTFEVNNPAYGKVMRNGSEENLTDPSKTYLVSKTGGLKFGLSAVAASDDYVLVRWELNGKELTQFKSNNTYPGSAGASTYIDRTADLIFSQDSVLRAVFQPKTIKDGTAGEYYTVCYKAENGGTVSAKEEYYIVNNPSDIIGSEAKASRGYLFDAWYQGGTKVSSDALFKPSFDAFKDLADENKTVTYTAKFTADQGTISGSGGSGSGSGSSGSGSGELILADLDKQILSSSSEEGPDGAEYGKLTLRVAKAKKTSVKLKWNAMSGATGYVLYGAKCGTKFERIGLINGTSYTVSSLKKGTYYKYKLVAVKIAGNKQTVVGHSKVVHAATTGGKVGNPKKIVLKSKKKVTLKKGKSKKIKVKVTKPAGKKVKKHRKVAYESSDPKVATVNAKGKITAVGQGTCKIYVYTQNGLYKAVNVKVK